MARSIAVKELPSQVTLCASSGSPQTPPGCSDPADAELAVVSSQEGRGRAGLPQCRQAPLSQPVGEAARKHVFLRRRTLLREERSPSQGLGELNRGPVLCFHLGSITSTDGLSGFKSNVWLWPSPLHPEQKEGRSVVVFVAGKRHTACHAGINKDALCRPANWICRLCLNSLFPHWSRP